MTVALDVASGLEQALRAGYSLRQAVERVADDLSDPESIAVLESALAGGGGVLESVDQWSAHNDDPDLELIAAAVRLQLEDEGNLADKLGLLHRILERRAG